METEETCRHTIGDLMGAIGYIVEHDDAAQTNIKISALNGTISKLLCNERIREIAAPGFAVTRWEV